MNELAVATPIASAASSSRKRRVPAVTVVVSSHNRAALLDGLLDALEAQDYPDFEVVVADNGSTDDTWSALTARCAHTSMRLRAVRLEFHDGPAVPRNTCISLAHGALIAFTDDDCLPTPGWLSAIVAAFDDAIVLVQGRTVPEPGGWAGPWGRSLTITGPTGLYETANLAARRTAILEIGGFAGERLLSGRAFGEDVLLGSAIVRNGGFRFASDAVVHHRVMPGTYRDFLEERRRLAGFPLLLRQVPELRSRAYAGVFLSRRTALTDLGVAAIAAFFVVNVASWWPWFGLVGLGVAPWIVTVFRECTSRQLMLRRAGAQLMLADLVGLGALLIGSVRARRLLL